MHISLTSCAAAIVYIATIRAVAQVPPPSVVDGGQPSQQSSEAERVSVTAQRDQLWKAAHQLEGDNKCDEAITKMQEMIPLERRIVGDQHEELVVALSYLADLEVAVGKLDAAKKSREDALKIKVDLYGKDDWQTKEARLAVADCDILAKLSQAHRKEWNSADESM